MAQAAAAAVAPGGSRNGRWAGERSPSPAPPLRGHVPMQENGGVAAADAAGGCFPGVLNVGAGQGAGNTQQLSLVEALTRIAQALENGGVLAAGEENAAAASSAAATVAAAAAIAASASVESGGSPPQFGSEDKLGHVGGVRKGLADQLPTLARALTDIEARLRCVEREGGDGGSPQQQPSADNQRELELLRARSTRLEHEVGELRAQCARRLDAATRDAAACRTQAEEARAQADALRAEVEELRLQVAKQQAVGGAAVSSPGEAHRSPCDDAALASRQSGGTGALDAGGTALKAADGRPANRASGSIPQSGPARALGLSQGTSVAGSVALASAAAMLGPTISQR